MTPLRAQYIRDLVIFGRSKNTQEAYTRYVCVLARFSPLTVFLAFKNQPFWRFDIFVSKNKSSICWRQMSKLTSVEESSGAEFKSVVTSETFQVANNE